MSAYPLCGAVAAVGYMFITTSSKLTIANRRPPCRGWRSASIPLPPKRAPKRVGPVGDVGTLSHSVCHAAVVSACHMVESVFFKSQVWC